MKTLKTLRNWADWAELDYRGRDVAIALGSVAIATLVNLLVWPKGANSDGHYFALMTAVLITALYGGLGPGLEATALAGLSSAFFTLSPQFSITIAAPGARERLTVFITEGVLLSLMAHLIRSHRKSEFPRVAPSTYLAIPLAAAAATIPKVIFPDLARELPFAFNYAAVCVCAWTGGLVSGIAATVLLAAIAKYLFLEPLYSLSVASHTEMIRVDLFVGEALLLAMLGDSHVKLKKVAANAFLQARAYVAGSLSREQDAAAIRAISRDTIWEWGLDTGEIIRSPSWQDALSGALPVREEFESWVERIHPQDRETTVARLQLALKEGKEELQYTYRLLAPDGRFLSVWDHVFIVRGANWEPLRLIGRSAQLPGSHSGAG